MRGIAGIIGRIGADVRGTLQCIADTMSYRGRDDVLFLLEGPWLLNLPLIAPGFFIAAVAWYG